MTLSIGFWVLFWAEILTSLWAFGNVPLDYHRPYPTLYSYIGEHVLVWGVVIYLIHVSMGWFKRSPFIFRFERRRAAFAAYGLVGVLSEVSSSLFLWHEQVKSSSGVKIWVDTVNPHPILRSFILARTITWTVVFCLLFIPVCAYSGKKFLLNQTDTRVKSATS